MYNFITILIFFLFANSSQGLTIIRDDEAEKFIFKAISPILRAANIPEKEFKLYILDDKSINAFTTGGNKIFINAGLITNFDDVKVLQGVVAHEIGHLLANHVVLTSTNYRELNNMAAVGNFLGIVGGALLGSGELASAASVTSSQLAATKFFSYSRSFENQADNIALKLLKEANISSIGLQQILQKLHKHENEVSYLAYARTHPTSISRINNIKQFNYNNAKQAVEENRLQEKYKHIVIKFKAFTSKIPNLRKEYQDQNNDDAKYAKAIVFYREGKAFEAVSIVDNLLKNRGNDPYLYELKGQILFEAGKLTEAAKAYKQALNLLPSSALIKLQYAICLIQTNDKLFLQTAKALIEEAELFEKENVLLFHYLAIVYGKLGLVADADLAMSEKFMLLEDNKRATYFAKRALSKKEQLKSNAKLLKLNDLLNFLN